MTRISAPGRAVARSPRHSRPTLAATVLTATALAALALAACGTEETSAGGSLNQPAAGIRAQPAAVPPGPDRQVAFMDLLNTVGPTTGTT
ncbi:hypothetical protein ABZS81_00570 [Streptomyces sp. NPDC005318]|uniref:hypothetical protein n=1 Tax=Streptomyces sp. NPDC005318 TaxID=3157031 RepID=UPI0033A48724